MPVPVRIGVIGAGAEFLVAPGSPRDSHEGAPLESRGRHTEGV